MEQPQIRRGDREEKIEIWGKINTEAPHIKKNLPKRRNDNFGPFNVELVERAIGKRKMLLCE